MRINNIRPQNELTSEKVKIISHLKADGFISRSGRRKTNYYIVLESANKEDLKKFESDLKKVYGIKPKWDLNNSGKKPNKKNWRVFIRSKLAYENLQRFGPFDSYNWRVPIQIIQSSRQLKVEFLRVFFDDEATVLIDKKMIRLYSVNQRGLEQIHEMLKEFGISGVIRPGFGLKRNVFGLELKGKDITKFINI